MYSQKKFKELYLKKKSALYVFAHYIEAVESQDVCYFAEYMFCAFYLPWNMRSVIHMIYWCDRLFHQEFRLKFFSALLSNMDKFLAFLQRIKWLEII